jgi:hypothetical protein
MEKKSGGQKMKVFASGEMGNQVLLAMAILQKKLWVGEEYRNNRQQITLIYGYDPLSGAASHKRRI